jgi:hypothetical protein
MGFPPLFYCGVAALSQKRDVTRLKDRWEIVRPLFVNSGY